MIGIVILNYNTYDKTIRCIESIKYYTSIEYNIYIVDNNSSDGSYEKLLKKFNTEKNIIVIKSNKNKGYSAGNNIGIRCAVKNGMNYIAIINSDVYLVNSAIDILYDSLKISKAVAIGPSVLSLTGDETQLIRPVWTFKNYMMSKKPFIYFDFCKKQEYKISDDKIIFRGMVSGCCFMIKADIFQKINYFDENVFLFGEEFIISKKLDLLNYDCSFEPNAKIIHEGGGSVSKKTAAFERYHRYLSGMYYLKKYCHINYLYCIIVYLINFLPFLYNSFFYKDYKNLIKEFNKKAKKILFPNEYGE